MVFIRSTKTSRTKIIQCRLYEVRTLSSSVDDVKIYSYYITVIRCISLNHSTTQLYLDSKVHKTNEQMIKIVVLVKQKDVASVFF